MFRQVTVKFVNGIFVLFMVFVVKYWYVCVKMKG